MGLLDGRHGDACGQRWKSLTQAFVRPCHRACATQRSAAVIHRCPPARPRTSLPTPPRSVLALPPCAWPTACTTSASAESITPPSSERAERSLYGAMSVGTAPAERPFHPECRRCTCLTGRGQSQPDPADVEEQQRGAGLGDLHAKRRCCGQVVARLTAPAVLGGGCGCSLALVMRAYAVIAE